MRFSILGPLEVHDDNGGLLTVRQARLRSLLVMLLVNDGRLVPTDRIVSLMWGQDAPTGCVHAVHSYASALRRSLAPHGLLHNSRPGYWVDLATHELDINDFRALLMQATQAFQGRDFRIAGELLERACGLWRDPALPDFPVTPAMRGVARKLLEEYSLAQDMLSDTNLALGLHREAIAVLRQRTTEHPGHERAWMQLMIALYRSEMRIQALAAFTEARSALLESSGIEPGPSMQRLHEQILHDDPVLRALTSHLRQEASLMCT